MKRIRITGLAIVAVFAFGAVVAASASAAPTFNPWFECKEKAGGVGEYATKAECVNPAGKETVGGKWKRFPIAFTSKSGAGTLEVKGVASPVTCESDTNTGETVVANASGVTKVVVKFKGCKNALLGECKSGTTAGEIVTKELEGTLEYLKATEPKQVGLDLWATGRTAEEKTKGEFNQLLAKFVCGTTEITVRGSVIGEITPINKKVKTTEHFTLTYEQAGGVQKWTESEVEGKKVKDVLETSIGGGAFTQSGEETIDEVTPKKETEIKA